MAQKGYDKKAASSIPDELTGISASLFVMQDSAKERGLDEVVEFLDQHVFQPLDDVIQAHLEVNARDRMQGTIKQRKQGHKKPMLPYVAATSYDLRQYSPEFKMELERKVFPSLLRSCLEIVEDQLMEMLVKLLRSDSEMEDERDNWSATGTSFDALFDRHNQLHELQAEYASKEEMILKVNFRTKLLSEFLTYYGEQVLPLAHEVMTRPEAYCPPPGLYRKFTDDVMIGVNTELDEIISKWETANKKPYMARAERYREVIQVDIWAPFAEQSPSMIKRTSSTAPGTKRQSIMTPANTGVSGRKQSVAKPVSAKPGIAKRTSLTPSAGAGAAARKKSTTATATPIINDFSDVDKPPPTPKAEVKEKMVMERPVSHVRVERNAADFDETNKQGGRRINLIELKTDVPVDADEPYIKVACRVRPILEHEKGKEAVWGMGDEMTVKIDNVKKGETSFKMHYTANQATSQIEFYTKCQVIPLIEKSLDGQYVTVFAYGQTGSGKTYSIAGPEEVIGLHEGVRLLDPDNLVAPAVKGVLGKILEYQLLQHGIMPRGARRLFDRIVEMEAADPTIQFDVKCTYTEIYNENVYDLLGTGGDEALEVKMNTGEREGFYVSGLTEIKAKTCDDVMKVFMLGAKNRQVSSHAMNRESSRSHALFSMIVDKKCWKPKDNTLWIHRGKLTLVDLAGSESVKATKTTGKGLLETQGINTSLLHLSNLISSMAKDGQDMAHIPWRNSKLTMLLMESLANLGSTLMLANVSPNSEYVSENTNTLNFATKAANITGIRAKPVNVEESEMDALRNDCFRYKQRIDALEKENQLLAAENMRLKTKLTTSGIAF